MLCYCRCTKLIRSISLSLLSSSPFSMENHSHEVS